MAEIVNLRQVRKAKEREANEAEAAANRAKFGRTKGEKELEATRKALAEKALEAHRRDE